ncbi:hypothetical protein TGCOUG_307050, partial [Toxoplasma gondii COUG]
RRRALQIVLAGLSTVRVEHAGRMGGISTACRLMVSGWRVAAASRLRCGGEGADFHAEDGVERS